MDIFNYSKSKKIGIALFTKRKKLGLTQTELAQKSDLTSVTIGNVENGKSITLSTLFAMCDALNLTITLVDNDNLIHEPMKIE